VLRVEAYDRDGKKLLATGRLDSADNVVDLATSTVKLKAIFDNKDGALFPNQFVNARIRVTTLDNQTLIPAAAVQRGTPGTFVYVVGDDSTVAIRTIKIGATSGDTVAVASNLKAGERVVVDGTDKLRDGAKVEAAVDAPATGPAPHRKGPWNGPGGKPGADRPGGGGATPAKPASGADNPRRAKDPASSGT
jgi:multidrug efflux system membrane fusion protein